MRRRVRPLAVGFLLLAIAVLVAGTARAAGDRTTTLRRAVGNVLLGPFDVALSPVVTAQGVYESSRAAGYSVPTTAVLELIGGAGWYLPVTAGTASGRGTNKARRLVRTENAAETRARFSMSRARSA